MWHPPSTVERAFELACDMEKQLQVTDSFKLEFPTYHSREINEMSTEEISGDEQEVNEISRRKWVSNPSSHSQRHQHFNNNRNSNYMHQQQRPQEGNSPNSGCKSLRIPRLHCHRNPITTYLHNSAAISSRNLIWP